MLALLDFVLRHYPALESFERSTRSLSSFLFPPPSLLLSEACTLGNITWLDLIWAASCTRVEDRRPGWSLTNYLRSDPHYYRWQFARSLYAAAERGDLAVVEWLFAHFSGCEAPVDVVQNAARGGHLHVLWFLWEHRSGEQYEAEKTIATECSVNLGEVYRGGRWYGDVIRKSINNGQLVLCLDSGMVLDEDDRETAIKEALRVGESELAERLLPSGKSVLYYATDCPRPEMIAKVLDAGYLHWNEELAARALSNAAQSGNCELIQQILQLHSPFREDHSRWKSAWWEALDKACSCGDVSVLGWLMERPLGREVYKAMENGSFAERWYRMGLFCEAATKGNVEVMQYLYEKELVTKHEHVTLVAVREGQLNSVKWLADHDLIGDQNAFSYAINEAARYGRLDILQLFQVLDQAAGYEAVGLKRRCMRSALSLWGGTRNTSYWAAEGGHVAVLEWLQEHYPATCGAGAMVPAAASGHLDTVKWLHANRTERCSTTATYGAAESGHLDVDKWLYENRSKSRTPKAIMSTIRCGHLRIASWLHSKFPDFEVNKDSEIPHKSADRLKDNTSEALLFLRAIYPSIFTASFVRYVQEVCERERSSFSCALTLSWLEGNFPSS